MEIKSRFNKNGNTKLGFRMWSYSKLYGNLTYTVEINGQLLEIVGTCGHYCKGCIDSCYVKKSYRYPSVIKSHARNTLAMRESIEKTFESLNGQIVRARKKPHQIRINQSGELESIEEFRMWCKMAESHKEIQFYLYTKAYDIVIPELLNDTVPSNLTVLISVWHEHGIREYKMVADKGNVKCFAYDDNAFDYESHGLKLTTYCKAYDESGKMNHEITCERCQKCFNRNGNCKCIGCKAH